MRYVSFGEIMLRLSPPGYGRLAQAQSFDVCYGGAEANAAALLAQLGEETVFVTKLPEGRLGDAAEGALRRYGAAVSALRSPGRLGVYYLEKGASERASKVIYDRAGSAFSGTKQSDYDWFSLLSGADWFVLSGITPALSDELPAICLDALGACRKLGVKVCFDLNFRAALWDMSRARRVTEAFLPFTDLLIQGTGDFYGAGGSDAESVARCLCGRYGVGAVAMTERDNCSASDNGFRCLYYDGAALYRSRTYRLHIVDRVGGGDACTAGLLYGLSRFTPARAVEFAAAAGAFKHTIEGDVCLATAEEIEALANGGGGRIER